LLASGFLPLIEWTLSSTLATAASRDGKAKTLKSAWCRFTSSELNLKACNGNSMHMSYSRDIGDPCGLNPNRFLKAELECASHDADAGTARGEQTR
jgi:hypothetical protein